jgi:hypothetical protein
LGIEKNEPTEKLDAPNTVVLSFDLRLAETEHVVATRTLAPAQLCDAPAQEAGKSVSSLSRLA